jgi:predicted acetyltransferase
MAVPVDSPGPAAVRLRLRPLRPSDEATFLAAHRALAREAFSFGLFYDEAMPWPAYLRALDRQRRDIAVADGLVPSTFLVAEVEGRLVGRTSIRHRLNEHLAREGGHIGYAIVEGQRRRGYATEVLRQSLVIARSVGVDRVLITCDDDNHGSAEVIVRGGGVFESLVASAEDGRLVRRYWVD